MTEEKQYERVVEKIDNLKMNVGIKLSWIVFLPSDVEECYKYSKKEIAKLYHANGKLSSALDLLESLGDFQDAETLKLEVASSLIDDYCFDLEFEKALVLAKEIGDSDLITDLTNRYGDYLFNIGLFVEASKTYTISDKSREALQMELMQGKWIGLNCNEFLTIEGWECTEIFLGDKVSIKRTRLDYRDSQILLGDAEVKLRPSDLMVDSKLFMQKSNKTKINAPKVGMTREEVYLSMWGNPVTIETYDLETWTFSNRYIVEFENDRVITVRRVHVHED